MRAWSIDKSWRFTLVSVAVIAVSGVPAVLIAQAPTQPLAQVTVRRSRDVAPGMLHTRLVAEATGGRDPWAADLLTIDLSHYRIDVVLALGQVVGRETTSSTVMRKGAPAGVNGGFFVTSDPEIGDPAGFLVIDGAVVSEPEQDRPAIGFCDAPAMQSIRIVRPRLSLEIEPALPAGIEPGLNRVRASDDVVVYTPAWGRSTLTQPGGIEVVVDEGVIVRVTEAGSATIPDGGFVLSASGTQADPVKRRYGAATAAGIRIGVVDDDGNTVDVTGCDFTTAGPVVAERGVVRRDYAGEAYRESFVIGRHPRTAVGLSADGGTLQLFVIDGRQEGYSAGATLVELATLLVAEGSSMVYNLDGGGSTTMVVRGDGVVNRPSDGSERRPSDMLLVIPRK